MILHFIKSCFVPIKGRGTVGIFQNIIVITVWLTLICLLLSIVCSFWNGKIEMVNTVIKVVGNLFIGIVSSSLVVLFTTIIQFKKEREMKWRQFNSIVLKLMSVMVRLSDADSYNYDEEIELDYKRAKELLDEFIEFGNSLFWYNDTKEKTYNRFYIKIAGFIATFYSGKNNTDDKTKIIDKKSVYACLRYMSVLSRDYYRETINVYDEMRKDYKKKHRNNRLRCEKQ